MSILRTILLHAFVAAAAIQTTSVLAAPPKPPAVAEDPAPQQTFERLPGFSAVVLSHVGQTMGLDVLPAANGFPLDPGLFVTIGLDRVWSADRDVSPLQNGRVPDTVAAQECANLCPASLYDAFQAEWLALAIESTQRAVEIPGNVVIAAHGRLPVTTLLASAYAITTSRPLRPPSLSLVLASPGRGLRGQPFFVLPPDGLRINQGSAALGLQVRFGRTGFSISAEDPQFNREVRAANSSALRTTLREVKKRYPGKQAIILLPDETVTVADLVQLMVAVRADFPRIILSAGQDLVLQ
jgi:hypothetical protein